MKFTLKIEIDDKELGAWIDFLVHHNDIFQHNRCGYWLYGVEHDETPLVKGPVFRSAIARWRFQPPAPLPPRFFRLDRAAAIKAYVEGIKRGGIGWQRAADASEHDAVLQLALLGEVRYG